MSDLDRSIQVNRAALKAISPDHPRRAQALVILGTRLCSRYQRTGTISDLVESIQLHREAVEVTPQIHPERAGRLYDLGCGLGLRYQRTGAVSDLEDAIRVNREAVQITHQDHPEYMSRLNNLAVGLGLRYQRTGDIGDLGDAIEVSQKAVKSTPKGHPDRVRRLYNLVVALVCRYRQTGAMGDLEDAICVVREAIDTTANGQPDHANCLDVLGTALAARYDTTGLMTDLEDSIKASRNAVKAAAEDEHYHAIYLHNLGVQLIRFYRRTGATTDLEEAIQVSQEALNTSPQDHPDRLDHLEGLGVALGYRYERTGAMKDLTEAIRVLKQVVDTVPEDNPDRGRYLFNLGGRLGDRYMRTSATRDLEEAIRVSRDAVNTTTEDHPDRATYLDLFAVEIGDRYYRVGDISDLEESIQISREALAVTPQDHPERAQRLHNLGVRLIDRYHQTQIDTDFQEALETYREAVKTTPKDDPAFVGRLINLGVVLGERYRQIGAMNDIEEAIELFQTALLLTNSSIALRIRAGINGLTCCAHTSQWKRAYEVASVAVALLPKLNLRTLQHTDKQYLLSQVVGLASDTAAVALRLDESPSVALSYLEQARGVLATSIVEMRTDITRLEETAPQLAQRFVSLRDEIDILTINDASPKPRLEESVKQVQSHRYREIDREFDQLVDEIRKQPGFRDFLLPPSPEAMQTAAKYGPVVVVNTSLYGCDAIPIEKQQIRSLYLPNLHVEDIQERVEAEDLGSLETLQWLWKTVAKPILDAAGITQPPAKDIWPRIWWIPTGLLSKFPLHAAGYHTELNFDTVLDRAMSSYSSSVRAIIQDRQRLINLPSSLRALTIAMSDTPGYSKLPFATLEVATLHGLFKSAGYDIVEPKPHKLEVEKHLLSCQIFHFAGHGDVNRNDPSQSRLLLKDYNTDPLTVASLLELNIRAYSPFLAYLSACGTGEIGDEKFLDESIHLISAFQLSGFRHVIGTLWKVNDRLCEDIAKITYGDIIKRGMTDEAVCHGLHLATRELRSRWLTDFEVVTRSNHRVHPKRDTKLGNDLSLSTADPCRSHARKPRNIEMDDDDRDSEAPLWVPYVHFGL